MSGEKRSESLRSIRWKQLLIGRDALLLWLALSTALLLLGMIWGDHLPPRAFITLHQASDPGRVISLLGQVSLSHLAPFRSWLEYVLLNLAQRIGISLSPLATALSLLGWSSTAVAVFLLLRGSMPHPIGSRVGLLGLFMVAINPMVFGALGTQLAWVVALGTLLVYLMCQKSWYWHGVGLLLLLSLSFDPATIGFVLCMLVFRWRIEKRFPLGVFLMGSLVIAGLTAATIRQTGRPFVVLDTDPEMWLWYLNRLLVQSELYVIFLMFMAIGLVDRLLPSDDAGRSRSYPIFLLGLWGLGVLYFDQGASAAILAVFGLILTAFGIGRLIRFLIEHEFIRIAAREPKIVLIGVVIAGLPLLTAESTTLMMGFRTRPLVYDRLQTEAADWLLANSERNSMIVADPRIGFLADRPIRPWMGMRGDEKDVPALVMEMVGDSPDYVVSSRTFAWEQVTGTRWFRERYEPVARYASDYAPSSPIIIWKWVSSPYEAGDWRSLNVETPLGMTLVGCQTFPAEIEPGGTLYVTLYWQATGPIKEAFQAVVRVVSTVDGTPFAQSDLVAPRTVPSSWWQPGQVIPERYEMEVVPTINVGAHEINLSLRMPRSNDLLSLHENFDPNSVDRVRLGFLTVPWEGKVPDDSTPVGASFGDRIQLGRVALSGSVEPGSEMRVTLYWEAISVPQADYTVFLHVVDDRDQLLASHDSRPMGGAYNTLAWLPGHVIPDEHALTLPDNLNPEGISFRVGLYLPETGERLPVRGADGEIQPDGFLQLPIE